MRNDKDNLIINLSFKFALAVMEYCKLLEENRKFVIANQLSKSGNYLDTSHLKEKLSSITNVISKIIITSKKN
jgi:hypothetical protein